MTLILPQLLGQMYPVHKRPAFSTKVATHVSGREVRVGLYAHTLYEYEIEFEALDSAGLHPGVTANSLQTFMGFFLQCQGQLNSFFYNDPTDNTVTSKNIGTGDGTTTAFTLTRTIGGYVEPVSYVNTISSVKVNGVTTGAYTITYPNTIVFTTAPASGYSIVWSGTFYFQCRFLVDQLDFVNDLNGLWSLPGVKFRQVR